MQTDNLPFGTRRNVYGEGYEWIKQSLSPVHLSDAAGRKHVGGPHCSAPYDASIMNIR